MFYILESLLSTVSSEEEKTHLDYILDITIAYPNGEPLDLPTIVTGNRDPFQTHFLYRLYPTSQVNYINISSRLYYDSLYLFVQVPKNEEALTAWLYDRWSEKERLLEEFYKYGTFSFPGSEASTLVQQDMLRFIIINLFFITSSYVHLQLMYAFVGYCNSYIYTI